MVLVKHAFRFIQGLAAASWSSRTGFPTRCGFLLACHLFFLQPSMAQQAPVKAEIEKAIADGNITVAEALLQKQAARFWAEKRADSLNNYILIAGKIEQQKTGADGGAKKVQDFVERIKTLLPPPAILRQAYLEAGEYFGLAGRNNLAYNANSEALKLALAMPGKTGALLGLIESNLGTYAQRMGNISLSEQHQRRAFRYRLSDPATDAESLYVSYNNMGSIHYYASRLDSAVLFFNKAIELLKKTPATPVNQYYRSALVLNNVSGIYSLQGKTTQAIQALKTSILHLKTFVATKEPHPKKSSAVSLQFEATDNLAGIYKELGNYRQAHDLLLHSFRQKQQALDKTDPALFISQILLGQLYFAMKDYEKAQLFLRNGLEAINRADGEHTFWKADACNTLALLNADRKNLEKAAHYYERADSLYEASLQGEYDNIYLEFVSNAALFYAESGDGRRALAKSKKAYDYIAKTQGSETLAASYQLLNLAEVHSLLKNHPVALRYSQQALAVMNKTVRNGSSLLDSIKAELKKPRAILQKARAEYALLKTKNGAELTRLLTELGEALAIIERRKSILNDAHDITLLVADVAGLLQFMEKINLDLYKRSGDVVYLNRLVSLHESSLYNRIRSRLDRADTLQFSGVPPQVLAKEKSLKAAFSAALQGEGSHPQKMQAYFAASEAWNRFRESLAQSYPRYYHLRYASLLKQPGSLRQMVPANTTLVRYFFSDKDLYALVADEGSETLFPLAPKDLEKHIATLSTGAYDAAATAESLATLYRQLWAPLEKKVRHKKVVIVPDGILFSLSFETLTPWKITSFSQLAKGSLLGRHCIAYHYSLFLLKPQKGSPERAGNFVAFAPGFMEQIKPPYRAAATSAALPRNSYLSLLPQPFSIDLAVRTQKLLGGNAFLHEKSTVAAFRQQAGNHKIIHIGTHAEADNLHPEFSRLLFTRTGVDDEDHSLYLPEIYNCNLQADLAVLTACESGRTGYEDGEGMISLAHAFHYAGSESMVTGLWKIDEQASALLIDAFYKHLITGVQKDEALRLAKLDYLQTAEGRALAPQYWAGLVIMGNTLPVQLETTSHPFSLMIVGGLFLLFVGGVFFFLRGKLLSN